MAQNLTFGKHCRDDLMAQAFFSMMSDVSKRIGIKQTEDVILFYYFFVLLVSSSVVPLMGPVRVSFSY